MIKSASVTVALQRLQPKRYVEQVDGRGDNDRNGERVPTFDDSYLGNHLSAKATTKTLQNFRRVTSQARPYKRGRGLDPTPHKTLYMGNWTSM